MKFHSAAFLLLLLPAINSEAGAQSRYQNSLTLSAGIYATEGFGTNPYGGVRYTYFLPGWQYFVEASVGVSSLKSAVLETISRSQLFDSQTQYSYEFVFAYDATPTGYLPYILGGVAGLNQGGQTKFAGVIGLGKRIPFGSLGSSQLGFRYDIRDQIYSQQISNAEPFLAHNLTFTVGLQWYF